MRPVWRGCTPYRTVVSVLPFCCVCFSRGLRAVSSIFCLFSSPPTQNCCNMYASEKSKVFAQIVFAPTLTSIPCFPNLDSNRVSPKGKTFRGRCKSVISRNSLYQNSGVVLPLLYTILWSWSLVPIFTTLRNENKDFIAKTNVKGNSWFFFMTHIQKQGSS